VRRPGQHFHRHDATGMQIDQWLGTRSGCPLAIRALPDRASRYENQANTNARIHAVFYCFVGCTTKFVVERA
jgi:hypothetical protein